jgi:hypothetical protein
MKRKLIYTFKKFAMRIKLYANNILDPASFNLKNRVQMNDPILAQVFKLSRDYCYAINSVRMKLLKSKDITSEK